MPDERPPNLGAEPASASKAPADDGFAADLAGESLDTPAAAPSEPVKPAPSFDVHTVDWYRTKPEDLPEAYRPVQRLVKDHLAQRTRAEQEAATLRRHMEAQQQQQVPAQQQMVQALERLAPTPDKFKDLRERLAPEEASAIDVVREILRREMEDSLPKMEPLQQELGTLKQAVLMMATQLQQQQLSSQAADLQGVVSKYGAEQVQASAQTLRGLLGVLNAVTGKAYTLPEAADLILGQSSQARAHAQERDAAVRGAAQRSVAGTPSVPAGSATPLTNDQVLAGLRELGFK